VEPLIAAGGSVPDNKVIGAVSGRYPRRTSTVLAYTPRAHDRWRTRCGNSVGPDRTDVVMESNISPLAGMVSNSGRPSVYPAHVRCGHS
jgi:hypothetical protein